MKKHGKAAISVKRQSRGQSMVEYLVVCGVLVFILFVPITSFTSDGKGKTTVDLLLDALKLAYKKFSYSLSLPT